MHRTLILLGATFIAIPRTSVAGPKIPELRWTRESGAEACIDEPNLADRVEQRLGRALRIMENPARVIVGTIERTPGGYRARIVTHDDRGELGERELNEQSADCRALDDKLSLVIALAIDSNAVDRELVSAETAVTPAPAQTQVASPTRAWGFALGVSGFGALGILPGLGLGGRLSFLIDPPSLPAIVVATTAWVPDREEVMAGGGRFTLAGGGVAACPNMWRRPTIGIAACGGVEVARMTATGYDFESNRQAIDWLAFVTGEAVLTIPLPGPFSLGIGLGGWLPLVRPRFVYTAGASMREVYQPSVIGGMLRVGIAVRL